MSQQDQPDLDLIAMVQRARMQHDADAKPSQISAVYWIEAKPAGQASAKTPTTRAGYFSVIATTETVDDLWARVKTATEAGTLGYKSKVSTASRGDVSQTNDREIRVQTYDADDAGDVARVKAELIRLGISDLSYHAG